MKLLLDAGNSRIKWAVHDGHGWCASGVASHDAIPSLSDEWQGMCVSSVYAANVAGHAIREALERVAPQPVIWVHSEACRDGVTNHYRAIAEHGADRWLAVLAARARCKDDVVVACAGTALTVEALTAEGDYLGGVILPGYRLMLGSLASGTAQLDREPGDYQAFPVGTRDALASGALDGLAGAISRMRERLAAHTGRPLPKIILTGGDAGRIGAVLAADVDIVDNLVLEGLLKVANS